MQRFIDYVNESLKKFEKLPDDVYNFIKSYIEKTYPNNIFGYAQSPRKLLDIASASIARNINTTTADKESFLSQDWCPKINEKYLDTKELETMIAQALVMMVSQGEAIILRRDANIFKDNARGYRFDLMSKDYYNNMKNTTGNPVVVKKF